MGYYGDVSVDDMMITEGDCNGQGNMFAPFTSTQSLKICFHMRFDKAMLLIKTKLKIVN